MNWARDIALLMSFECAVASVLYFIGKDVRHGLYFALAAGINLVVIL